MNDNIVSVSNTPIFDQLAREMASKGKDYEVLTEGSRFSLRPVGTPSWRGYMAPGAYIDELTLHITETEQTDKFVNAARTNPLSVSFCDALQDELTIYPDTIKTVADSEGGLTYDEVVQLYKTIETVRPVTRQERRIAENYPDSITAHLSEDGVVVEVDLDKLFDAERLEYFKDVPSNPPLIARKAPKPLWASDEEIIDEE